MAPAQGNDLFGARPRDLVKMFDNPIEECSTVPFLTNSWLEKQIKHCGNYNYETQI